MREFLMELYLLYGEREFGWMGPINGRLFNMARNKNYIFYNRDINPPYTLTPKAIEYLKHD